MRDERFDGTEVGPGYCRLVRVGNQVFVSGTGSADRSGTVIGADVYEQTKEIYRKMQKSLSEVGCSLSQVARVCAYVTDINTAKDFLKAHGEAFGDANPSATLVEVSGLVNNFKVEIEA